MVMGWTLLPYFQREVVSIIAEARQSRGQMAIESLGLKYFKAFQHKGNWRLRTFPQIDKEPRCH